MEAKELRIGNYYEYAGNYVIVTTRLKGIKINEFGFYSDLDDTNLGICKPIPLTEEILLKCGFTFCDMVYSFNGFEILNLKQGLEFFNYDYPIKLDYLHQLQNLYFALTNEELTVNL